MRAQDTAHSGLVCYGAPYASLSMVNTGSKQLEVRHSIQVAGKWEDRFQTAIATDKQVTRVMLGLTHNVTWR